MAPSCSVPVGWPSASRSNRPWAGSGVSRVRPASSSARVFTQAPWWSRLGRKTGRSGTTESRSAAVGVPPGKADIAHPPPRIQGSSGCASAYALMVARYSSRVCASVRSQRTRSSPPCTACTCASTNPGLSSPPPQSTTSAPAGTSPPTDAIRPPSTTTGPTSPTWWCPSKTAALTKATVPGKEGVLTSRSCRVAGWVVERPTSAAGPCVTVVEPSRVTVVGPSRVTVVGPSRLHGG